MNWSGALNVAIGLTLVYLAFSVAAFTHQRVRGQSAAMAGGRAGTGALHHARRSKGVALDIGCRVVGWRTGCTGRACTTARYGSTSAQAVKNYPAIAAMESVVGKNRRISYLPSRAFSAAVLDILVPPVIVVLDSIADKSHRRRNTRSRSCAATRTPPISISSPTILPADSEIDKSRLRQIEVAIKGDPVEQFQAAIKALPETNPARRTLLRMATDAGESPDAFRAKLEHWYDDGSRGSPAGTSATSNGGSSPSGWHSRFSSTSIPSRLRTRCGARRWNRPPSPRPPRPPPERRSTKSTPALPRSTASPCPLAGHRHTRATKSATIRVVSHWG